MAEFKAPQPHEGELIDLYITRLAAEFERWVNEHFKPEERDAHP